MNKNQRLRWLPSIVQDHMAEALGRSLDYDFLNLEHLVCEFQKAKGLAVDGWPGRQTAQALYGCGKPIPRNRRELRGQLGVWRWQHRSPTNLRDRRVTDLDGWGRRNISRFELHNGDFVRLHKDIGEEFVRLFEVACVASGYTPENVQSYNPRVIGGTDRLSMHAWGVAVDFDPQLNPWGGVILKGPRKGEPSLMRQNILFVEVFEWAGWTWGGRWRGNNGDDMHFQRKD